MKPRRRNPSPAAALELQSIEPPRTSRTWLIQKATEIKVRAERKAGEMLRIAAEQGQRATPSEHGKGIQSSVDHNDTRVTLSQIGITRDQSSRRPATDDPLRDSAGAPERIRCTTEE